MFSGSSGVARLSLITIVALVVLKVSVGAVTGSLSVLAQAADSFLDLFAVVVTFLAVRIAVRPADEGHPFGHGKAENIAAIVQAGLILIASGSIVYAAARRILSGGALRMTEADMAVMAVSILASVFLARRLRRVAREEDSPALEANARNIAADVYSAAAVLVGLLVVRFTGWAIIDPILAVLVALFLIKVAVDVLRRSLGELVDVRLPDAEESAVRAAIAEHFGGEVVSFHKLRTRKAGNQRYIDLHLVMPKHISLEAAHDMCEHLEADIKARLKRTDVTIHVEPCDENCDACKLSCEERK